MTSSILEKQEHLLAALIGWLLYPLAAVLSLGYLASTDRRWITATISGVVVFVVLMALLPIDFDPVGVGSRLARPVSAYLAGLALTGVLLVVAKSSK
jgi:hypothetical protein